MIQLGDQLASLEDIGPSLAWIHRRHCETLRPKPTIVIYADKNVPMAMIKAVKRELQLHNLLKVSYRRNTDELALLAGWDLFAGLNGQCSTCALMLSLTTQ
jgi:hypothetical protein